MARHADTAFYVVPEHVTGEWLTLTGDEARHAARVLRLREGDGFTAVDGSGGWYRAEVTEVARDTVSGRIVERRHDVGEPSVRLTVGLGLLKNPARFETFLEKAVELGVTEILPLVTARTERTGFKAARAQGILIAAMKQSGRTVLPALPDPVPIQAVLQAPHEGLKLLCHETADPAATILRSLDALCTGGAVRILVGPEGGFSPEEVDAALEAGYLVCSLGERRLRAETAAITAAAAVQLVSQHLNKPPG